MIRVIETTESDHVNSTIGRFKMTQGKFLKNRRNQLGFSVTKVAVGVGLTNPYYVKQWEADRAIKEEYLKSLQSVLNCEIPFELLKIEKTVIIPEDGIVGRIAKAVRETRKARGISQQVLGKRAGVSRVLITTIERGLYYADTPAVRKVFTYLEIDIDALL